MQFAVVDVITWGCVAWLFAIGVWFASAVHHFDKQSPRKPLLVALLALSAATAAATVYCVATNRPTPELRSLAAAAGGLVAALLFRASLKAIRNRSLSLAFSRATPPAVVSTGPYRFVRHPLYVAYVLFWCSCALLAGTLIVALLAAAIFALYAIAARMEEADIMRSELARDYSPYRATTGMLIPKIKSKL